jgi:type I restriction enzyme M protein
MSLPNRTSTPTTTAQTLGSLVKSSRDLMRKDKGLSTDLDGLPMLTWILWLKFLDDLEQVREAEAALEGKRHRPAIAAPYRWRDWAAKPDGITGDALVKFIVTVVNPRLGETILDPAAGTGGFLA